MLYQSIVTSEIPSDRPKRVTNTITVPDTGRALTVELRLNLAHTRPSDLRLFLKTPSGRKILIRERSKKPFLNSYTVLSAGGEPIFGNWKLIVEDVKATDGGALNSWALDVATYDSPFLIELDFKGGLTDSQKAVFTAAKERMQNILFGVMSAPLTVVIGAKGIEIDGRGGILGQAGPTKVRQSDMLPTAGIMEFDKTDIVRMEINGSLTSLLLHEMAHVLGFGTLFKSHKMVKEGFFIGPNASREYGGNRGLPPEPVPLEDEGGAGTAGAHWDEEVFGHELMTGYMTGSAQPFSRISVGAFEDIGYNVDYSFADKYLLGMRSLVVGEGGVVRTCNITRPEFEVVQ